MKKLLLIVFPLLFLSAGISQNRLNVNNLVQYGDKYFKENDDRPFNGILFDMSKETGNKILQYKMVDGLKNGSYQEWYPDGKPKLEGSYKDGLAIGKWTLWYENGQMEFEGSFKDGRRDGLWNLWYENGQKSNEGTFKDGKQISFKVWNEDGSVRE